MSIIKCPYIVIQTRVRLVLKMKRRPILILQIMVKIDFKISQTLKKTVTIKIKPQSNIHP